MEQINGINHLIWLLQTLTNTDIFRGLLSNNSKHSFQSSYLTILTLQRISSKQYYKIRFFSKTFLANNPLRFIANHESYY